MDSLGQDIYLTAGYRGAHDIIAFFHESVCVDIHDDCCRVTGRKCFTFGFTSATSEILFGFVPWITPHGKMMEEKCGDVSTMTLLTKHTSCTEDQNMLDKLESEANQQGNYFPVLQDCERYSENRFIWAPDHF